MILRRIAIPGALLLCAAGSVAAHDFWLVPNAFTVGAGQSIEVLGRTSSKFPTSESAVTTDRVASARLLSASSNVPIRQLSVSDKSLKLSTRPAGAGQHVVATTLHWRSNRESVESFRRYLELEGAPAALERIDREGLLAGRDSLTRRYAKYAKVIVQVGNGRARAFGRVAGHPLEFVPLSDPAAARVGDTLSARLLYMGRPLAGIKVHAGAVEAASALSDHPVVTAPDVDVVTDAAGVVRIPVSAAGAWNLRTIHIAQSPRGAAADWDAHWATLVFQVAEPVPSARADSAAVVGTIEAYHSALQRGDSIAALALLTPDAVILESGGLETKAEYRSHHLPGDIRFAQAIPRQRTPVSVSVRGNVAWAWSTSITQGEYQGRQINSASAELMVVTRTSSGWRISAIHWSSRARR